MAAAQYSKLLFVLRSAQAQAEASPAVLRLLLAASAPSAGEQADALCVHILKRRGPPLTQPLVLPARPGRLGALLRLCGTDQELRSLFALSSTDRRMLEGHALDSFAALA
jgi:protein ImuA